jgi:hypothetical protein
MMLRYLNNRRAQAVVGEYALVIFMVLGALVAMTVYFKRSVQGRMHDARDYMVDEVRSRTAGSFDGDLYYQYEPYYTRTDATVTRSANHSTTILPGASSGIFQKVVVESTSGQASSETAPPRDFDLTTPQ